MNAQKIAIIGSGISGLTCASLLHRNHEVAIFEANNYIGGHTNTVEVNHAGQTHQVDTGFIVSNERNYDNFFKWLDTCPVHLNITKVDNDYIEVGFFSVMDEEE